MYLGEITTANFLVFLLINIINKLNLPFDAFTFSGYYIKSIQEER
jgi:hypothetical protein